MSEGEGRRHAETRPGLYKGRLSLLQVLARAGYSAVRSGPESRTATFAVTSQLALVSGFSPARGKNKKLDKNWAISWANAGRRWSDERRDRAWSFHWGTWLGQVGATKCRNGQPLACFPAWHGKVNQVFCLIFWWKLGGS